MVLRTTVLVLAIIGMFNAASVFAADQSVNEVQGLTGLEDSVEANQSLASDETAGHIHWDFIGCTCEYELCAEKASDAGFPHFKVRHEPQRCFGHEELACYGGHH